MSCLPRPSDSQAKTQCLALHEILTAAGRVLYVRAQSILRQFDELRDAVHREIRPLSGTVMLGISPTMLSRFGLALLERVCTQHAEMHLQIREEGSVVLNELL